MIKKIAISAYAAYATIAHAGYGGMGVIDDYHGDDLSLQQIMFTMLGFGIAYVFMKSTNIGQQVEDFCGPFWGVVVIVFATAAGLGILRALFF